MKTNSLIFRVIVITGTICPTIIQDPLPQQRLMKTMHMMRASQEFAEQAEKHHSAKPQLLTLPLGEQ